MTYSRQEIVEQQADIMGLLLHHIHAPLVDAERVRGVLPVAAPAEAIRVVVGAAGARQADRLTAYEIPLRENDGLRNGYDVIALLRTVLSAPRPLGAGVGAVMGMPSSGWTPPSSSPPRRHRTIWR